MTDALTFSSVRNCRDIAPRQHQAAWGQFADWLRCPAVRAQKDGPALIFAVFGTPKRADCNVTACTALAFDVEQGHQPGDPMPPAPEQMHDRLQGMGAAHVVWTTFSHAPAAPRYRLVLPVSEPFAPSYLADLLVLVAESLGIAGIIDKSCTNPSRLMYAPAVHPDRADDYRSFAFLEAPALDVGDLVAEVLDQREQRRQEQEDRLAELQRQQAARLARRTSGERGQDVLELIRRFNESTSIEQELEQAGYCKRGKRWIAPTSHSGIPGCTILGGKVYSHHEGDPIHDGKPHDPWDVRVAYAFNGDRVAAVRALREGRI